MAVLAIDIGGTNTRMGVFTAPGRCLERSTTPNALLGQPVAVDRFLDYLEGQMVRARVLVNQIDAVGVAVAAVVDAQTGHIQIGENVGWQDLALGQLIRRRLGVAAYVDTDAFCGTLAESRLGAGVDWPSFLYVTIGTGIGHGFMLNHHLWHGAHAAANVFGHIKVVANGEPCYCGGAGCLCMYASGDGIAYQARKRLSGATKPSAKAVIQAAVRSEAWAAQIVDQALDALAFALSSAFNLVDIEGAILDGGAVSELYPDLSELSRRVDALVYPLMRPVSLRLGKLRGESVLQGAALLAFEAVR
jgi:glucokinase